MFINIFAVTERVTFMSTTDFMGISHWRDLRVLTGCAQGYRQWPHSARIPMPGPKGAQFSIPQGCEYFRYL